MGRLIDADYIDERIEDELGIGADRQLWYEEIINDAPTVEAIPKADYENRLKADLVAILEELKEEAEELCNPYSITDYDEYEAGMNKGIELVEDAIQQKIDKLKGVRNDKKRSNKLYG